MTLLHGDCRALLPTLEAESVSAIVTDPPYGLAFMGKDWDSFVPGDIAMRRNPQMDAVNTGMSRQGGRQRACAGYAKRQARDMLAFQEWATEWAIESLRVAKPGAHLLAFGGTRTFHRLACAIEDAGWEIRDTVMWVYGSGFPKSHNLTGDWQGWGTALKPAWEPILVARKSLNGTVAENVQRYGTGALNIDGCRVAGEPWKAHRATGLASVKFFTDGDAKEIDKEPHDAGRWPANLIHDGSDEVLELFPVTKPDSGSAARFFYCAKASRSEREAGCEGLEERATREYRTGNVHSQHGGRVPDKVAANSHPTVKPLALMRWLCRLVTPPGGLILDPFTGSGSTGVAATIEGFRFLGIEQEADYIQIAEARIRHADGAP
jgi:site-specific DNA-methyltransferase (adenine-specific)